MVFYLPTIMRKVKPSIATISCHYWIDWAHKSRNNGHAKEKVLFYQGNAPCHRSIRTMVKLNELSFQLLPHAPYSPDLAPSDYWLFADMNKMLQRKIFGFNEEVISETKAYFEGKDEFYKKGIKKLEKHWNECIILKGNYRVSQLEVSFRFRRKMRVFCEKSFDFYFIK